MIKWRSIIRIVGLLISLLSFSMLCPVAIALIYGDGGGAIFVKSFFASLILGIILWFPNRTYRGEFNIREGFLIVILFWVVLGAIGSFPFLFDQHLNLDLTTAMFESYSGLTTTGSTTIANPQSLPKALLFYRQLQQWLGGMGIIVLAVAILPLLGVGGMQLYRAEIPGPQKNAKIKPRIAQTAKSLWFIYIVLTVLCCAALWISGMDFFDAISHSFSTIAIGGFSTHSDGLMYFNNPAVNYIVALFLVISGCNYGLHFITLSSFSFKQYLKDQEFRVFILIVFAIILITIVCIYMSPAGQTARIDTVVAQAVSMATTAGFTIVDTDSWPVFVPLFLMCVTFIGCCAGSTGGGMKVVRILILFLQASRELKRLVHPNAVYNLKLNKRTLPERVIEAVWGFFSAYILIFIVSFFIIVLSGVTIEHAFTIVTFSLNNVGISIDDANVAIGNVGEVVKWTMVIDMIFGRLEIFTLLIIFSPAFWRV